MDIKRGILLTIFIFSLLNLWGKWTEYNKPPAPPAAATSQAANGATNAAAGQPAAAGAASASATAATPAAPAEAPVVSQDVVVTTDVFQATFDTAGAKLKHLELLQFKETKSEWLGDLVMEKIHGNTDKTPPRNVVLFDSSKDSTYLAQSGLTDANLPGIESGYTVRPGARSLDTGDTLQVVFDAEKNGVKLTKTYTFKRGQYAIDVKHDVTNNTAAAITPTLDLRLVRDGTLPKNPRFAPNPYYGPAASSDTDNFQKQTFEKIGKGDDALVKDSKNGWVAMIQHFFVSAIVPAAGTPRENYTKALGNNLYAVGSTLHYASIAPGTTQSIDTTLYSGPEDETAMAKVSPTLERTRDYGLFAVVAKPIFWVMDNINKLIGNWGWTIIVFTILMKIVLFPLSASSLRSMAKTKQLAPKMQAIRERYKSDPQKMNQATMDLYKTEKVNPVGGCLPMLLQMPIFIALYSVLQSSVETRNAPWLGWLNDLSTPDPFSILPAIMMVAMFVQTKMNPAPPDPAQAKMMMIMPIAFSVMFFMFPSGVVLYYVVNTLLSMAQQQFINKKIMGDVK